MKLKGYLLGVLAGASYGTNPLFALPLYADGMNADSVLFFRYMFAVPILAAMCWWRGQGFRTDFRQLLMLVVMGVVVALSSLSLFASYNYMAAGIASTLLFVYPILVAVIMALVFREKLSAVTWICLLLAVAGIGLLYRGPEGATLSLIGTILAITSALTYAIYIVAVNKSRLDKVPTLKFTFYVLLFGFVFFGVRILCGAQLTVPSSDNVFQWGNLLALAVVPTAISFLCTTAAIKVIGPTSTAILGAFEPLTAIIVGLTIFGEVLTPREMLGIVMIIVAVTVVISGGHISFLRLRRLFPRRPRR